LLTKLHALQASRIRIAAAPLEGPPEAEPTASIVLMVVVVVLVVDVVVLVVDVVLVVVVVVVVLVEVVVVVVVVVVVSSLRSILHPRFVPMRPISGVCPSTWIVNRPSSMGPPTVFPLLS